MTALSAFYPLVNIHTSGVPEPLLETAVRNAAIEFCRSSLWLTTEIDPISVQAGINPYELDAPKDTVIIKVLSLYYDKRQLQPVDQMSLTGANWLNWQLQSGAPRMYTMFTPSEITLVPTPDASLVSGLTGRIAVAPTRTAPVVDDTLFDEYQEEVAAGAIARLKMLPGQAFSDAAGAAAFQLLFRMGTNRARVRATAGILQAPMMVRMRGRY